MQMRMCSEDSFFALVKFPDSQCVLATDTKHFTMPHLYLSSGCEKAQDFERSLFSFLALSAHDAECGPSCSWKDHTSRITFEHHHAADAVDPKCIWSLLLGSRLRSRVEGFLNGILVASKYIPCMSRYFIRLDNRLDANLPFRC